MSNSKNDVLKEAERIKEKIRKCSLAREVEKVASEERENVEALGKLPDGAVLVGQIKRLKKFTLDGFKFDALNRRGGRP